MSLSFTALGPVVAGSKGRSVRGTLTFDSSYPTGGEAYTASLFGLSIVDQIDFAESVSGYVFEHDKSNLKIKALSGASGTTGAGAAHTHAFTGTAPKSSSNYTVTHDGTPDGNNIYVKFNEFGPYLACNMATDTADKTITFADGEKVTIKHDASASTGGTQVYFDSDGATVSDRLLFVSPTNMDAYIRCHSGGLLKIKDDDSAATNGNAITYDDGTDERLESNCSTAADATISSHTSSWVYSTPAGTNANESTHTHSVSAAAAAEVANGTNLSSVAVEVEVVGI